MQGKPVVVVFERRGTVEHVACQLPELVMKPVQHLPAFDTNPLNNLLIEIIQELLARFIAFIVDLRFKFSLEGVKLETDLFGRAASLVNAHDPLLEIDA